MLIEIFDKKIELPIKNIMKSCSNLEELNCIIAEREESRLFYETHNRNIQGSSNSVLLTSIREKLSSGIEMHKLVDLLERYICSAVSITELKLAHDIMNDCFSQLNMSEGDRKQLIDVAIISYEKLNNFLCNPLLIEDDFSKDSHTQNQYQIYIELAMVTTLKLARPAIYYSVEEIVYFFNHGFLPTKFIYSNDFPATNISRSTADRLIKRVVNDERSCFSKISVGRKQYYDEKIFACIAEKSPKLKKLPLQPVVQPVAFPKVEYIADLLDDTINAFKIYVDGNKREQLEKYICDAFLKLYSPLIYADIQNFIFQYLFQEIGQNPIIEDGDKLSSLIFNILKQKLDKLYNIIDKEKVFLDIKMIYAFIKCMTLAKTENFRKDFSSVRVFLEKMKVLSQAELSGVFELFRGERNQLKFSNVIEYFIDEYLFIKVSDNKTNKIVIKELFKGIEKISKNEDSSLNAQKSTVDSYKQKIVQSTVRNKNEQKLLYEEIKQLCRRYNTNRNLASIIII